MSAKIDKMSAIGNDSIEVEPIGRIELRPEFLVRYALAGNVDYRANRCHAVIAS